MRLRACGGDWPVPRRAKVWHGHLTTHLADRGRHRRTGAGDGRRRRALMGAESPEPSRSDIGFTPEGTNPCRLSQWPAPGHWPGLLDRSIPFDRERHGRDFLGCSRRPCRRSAFWPGWRPAMRLQGVGRVGDSCRWRWNWASRPCSGCGNVASHAAGNDRLPLRREAPGRGIHQHTDACGRLCARQRS